jgi:hypothetical protein
MLEKQGRSRSLEPLPASGNNLDTFIPQQLGRRKSDAGIGLDALRREGEGESRALSKAKALDKFREYELRRERESKQINRERRRKEVLSELRRPKYKFNQAVDPVNAEEISKERVGVAMSNLSEIEVKIIRNRVNSTADAWRMEKAYLWMNNHDSQFERGELTKQSEEGNMLSEAEVAFALMTERYPKLVEYLNGQGHKLAREEFYRQVIFSSERDRLVLERYISIEQESLIIHGIDSERASIHAEQTTRRLMGEGKQWLLENFPEMDLQEVREKAGEEAERRIRLVRNERDILVTSGVLINEALKEAGWVDATRTRLMGEEQQWLLENFPEMDLQEVREKAGEEAERRIQLVRNERRRLFKSGVPINEALQEAGWVDATRTRLMGEEQQWLLENFPEMDLQEVRKKAGEEAERRIQLVRNERQRLFKSGVPINEALQQAERMVVKGAWTVI